MKTLFSTLLFCLAFVGMAQTNTTIPKSTSEVLTLDWQKLGNWQLANAQQNSKIGLLEFTHPGEKLDNWTEIGTCITAKDITGSQMRTVMELMYSQAKKNNPLAKLTLIDEDLKAFYTWILFKIEAQGESQLFYVVQGRMNLYTNFFGVKQPIISKEQEIKYGTFLKAAKFEYN